MTTGDELRERLAALSPEKRASLEGRLVGMRIGRPRAPGIPRHARPDACPLSFAQQRLWFIDQLVPGSTAYNIARAARLDGALDLDALRRALDAIVARHEVLRTTFAVVEGDPRQVVGDPRPLGLTVLDLTRHREPDQAAEVERLIAREACRSFDLAGDLMLRGTVLRLGPSAHVLLLVMHHIVADGWSAGLLFRELATLYDAFRRGQRDPLPELPIQYADYALWQRDRMQGKALARELAYWTRRLEGAPTVLEVPADRQRPAVQSFRGGRQSRVLAPSLLAGLKALARRERVTVFMTLLAGFQALLHRYTGQHDLCVGSAIAGRTHAETEPLIGFFVNTLVFRTDFTGDPTVSELLGRVRETALGAYAHQELPFDRLVEELKPERSLDRPPLVQVMFSFQDAEWQGMELPGVRVMPLSVDTGGAKFDLSLSMAETPLGLNATLEYSSDLFEAPTIERMLGHLQTLLQAMVAEPGTPISRLDLLTDAEQRQLLLEWNDTAREYPADRGVHALFETQAARHPGAVAVVEGARTLTYGELNARANRLARHLGKRGVGPEALVGVCLERSVDFLVAVLGILKAGGAYVPLDPAYPAERLAYILKDTRAAVLVTRRGLVEAEAPPETPLVCLDADAGQIAAEPGDDVVTRVSGNDLAYVMYTSGSTGQPKGVAVPHRAIARLVVNTDYITLTPSDAIGHASSVAFDAATFEIWGALLNGARLVVLPRDVVLAPRALGGALEQQGITVLFLTTALFNQIAQEAPDILAGVRHLLFGGEAADPRWVARVLEHGRPGRLVHVYGPTEATTFATWHPVEEVFAGARTVPIGRPISNTQVYVLDRHRVPLPVGVPGELWIGGPGLAHGYLRRPELTAQRFVAQSFSAAPPAVLYRTGDLARYRRDGKLEFVGRLDHQVKIRGHRVEPAEVEGALGRHPSVRQSVVLAREQSVGDRQLTAYVVSDVASPPTAGEFRAFLRRTLPEWMVPSAFVVLPSLPLTASGKVDRALLPVLAVDSSRGERDLVTPRDVLERQLAETWQEVLGVNPVGIRDNFFDLGGHSLLALRLFARIERIVGASLPLATLFQAPTVEQLADLIRQGAWSGFGSSVVAIQSRGSKPPIFALPGVGGNVLSYVDLARLLGRDQPFYGLQARGLDGKEAPFTRIEAMAAHHVEEARRVQPHGPYFLMGACMGAVVAFEMAQQLHARGERVAFLGMLDPARAGWRSRRRAVAVAALLRWLTVPRFVLGRLGVHLRAPYQLDRAGRRAYIRDKVRAAREMIVRRDLFRGDRTELYQVRVTEANQHALWRYVPRAYRGTLSLFVTTGRIARSARDRRLDWAQLADGGAEIHEVSGRDSGDMLTEPHVRLLVDRLLACLGRARAS